MIWYQHVHNMNSCWASLFLPTKQVRGQRKDAPISFWKLKHVFETDPPPALWEKALQQLSRTPDRALPQTSLQLLSSKPADDWRHPLHSHFTQLWSSISSDSRHDALLDFRGEKHTIHWILIHVTFVRGSIWPRAHQRGLRLTHSGKGWYTTSKIRSSQGISGSRDLYRLLAPG